MSHTENKTACPLCWPDGWARTAFREDSRFIRPASETQRRRHYTMEEARTFLAQELDRLGARDAILSTNVRLRLDGQAMSGQAAPSDPGAAVYFKLKKKDVSLACDKWRRVECNVYAIAKHIEALRGQERWGVGNIEQAFRGYMALPAPGNTAGDNPWRTLGLPANYTEEQLLGAWRVLSKKFHPDNQDTGNAEEFMRIKQAYDLLAQNLRRSAA